MKMRPLHGTQTLGNVHQLMGVQDLTRTVLTLGSVQLKLYTHTDFEDMFMIALFQILSHTAQIPENSQ
jgi:hypothetical protein